MTPRIENAPFRDSGGLVSRQPDWRPCGLGKQGLNRTVAFLAETRGSATIDKQKASLRPGDEIVLAGRRSFTKLSEILASRALPLKKGDRVKVYDLSCIGISTTTLIRVLTKMLQAGVSFEIVAAGIVIEPGAENKLDALLDTLDAHYRHVHGIKTNPRGTAPKGRKRRLAADQLGEIRAKLDEPGATATKVASDLNVARSTLFNYLDRYDQDRRREREKKAEERRSQRVAEEIDAPAGDTDKARS